MEPGEAVQPPIRQRRLSESAKILGAGLVLVLIGGLVWWQYQHGGPSWSDFRISEASGRLASRVAEAEQAAQAEWQPEAGLIVVSLTLEHGRLLDQFPPVAFFASSAEPTNDYYAEFDPTLERIEKTGTESKAPYQPAAELLRLYADEWTVPFSEILKTAEEKGGSDFRSAHPQYRIIMELTKTSTTGAEWAVMYNDTTTTEDGSSLKIYINAQTGDLNTIVT